MFRRRKKQTPINETCGSDPSDDQTSVTYMEKTVTFSLENAIYQTMPLSAYSPEEIEAVWFTQDEFLIIQKQMEKQLRKLSRGERLKDKKYCSRGLEGMTAVGLKSADFNRSLAWKAVLEVQKNQKEMGLVDEEAIAETYRRVSSSRLLWANIVGKRFLNNNSSP